VSEHHWTFDLSTVHQDVDSDKDVGSGHIPQALAPITAPSVG